MRFHMKQLLAMWHKEGVRKDDDDLNNDNPDGITAGEEMPTLLDM